LKDAGYQFEVLRNYDLLQRIVRNPEYSRWCEKISFDNDGFAETDLFVCAIHQECIKEIRKRFGLKQPIHPSVILQNKYSPEFFSQVPIFERDPFACMLEFHRSKDQDEEIVSTPIHDEQYLLIKVDRLASAKAVESAVKEYCNLYREYLPMGLKNSVVPACDCLQIDRDQARLKINMLSFDRDIFQKLGTYLIPPKERIHFKARDGSYAIWDMRMEREPFSKIALRFGVNEDQSRKRFRRAFDLITGQKYTKALWKELIRNHLTKRAASLEGEEQIKAFETLGEFEDKKSQEKELGEKRGSEEKQKETLQKKESIQANSLEDDQMAQVFLGDILERVCPECPDAECKAKGATVSTIKDLSILNCPRVYHYLMKQD